MIDGEKKMKSNMNTRLEEAITKAGYWKWFVAEKAGMDAVRLSQILHGWRKPREDEKKALAKALKVSVKKIF